MSASLDIVTIIRECAALVRISDNAPAFTTMELWQLNQIDDAEFPLIVLDRPIQENGKVVSQIPQGTYSLTVFCFSGKVDINADHSVKEPLLTIAKEMRRQLVLRIAQDARPIKLNSYTSLELPESKDLDINPCGIMMTINITVSEVGPVCDLSIED